MTEFYRYRDESRPHAAPLVCATHDDRLFLYVANTKLWHRDTYLESLLFFNDSSWVIDRVDPTEVAALVKGTERIDGRGHGAHLLRELREQPVAEKVTSAELGMETLPSDRPVAGGGLPELLASLRPGQKRLVARYPAERKGAAINFAHEVNSGKKRALADLTLSARATLDGDTYAVELERTS